MNLDIGYWSRDADGRRLQVNFAIFGGKITWTCKRGHHQPWEPYGPPSEEDWEIVTREAEKRVPRRVIHDKMMELIRKRGAKG
jgi:hypothetical protein